MFNQTQKRKPKDFFLLTVPAGRFEKLFPNIAKGSVAELDIGGLKCEIKSVAKKLIQPDWGDSTMDYWSVGLFDGYNTAVVRAYFGKSLQMIAYRGISRDNWWFSSDFPVKSQVIEGSIDVSL